MHLIRRGERSAQFYLVAAVIIVGVVIAIAGLSNYVSKKSEGNVKALNELKLEGESVVNYGIFSEEELNDVMTTFIEDYGQYIEGSNYEYIFVYADKSMIEENKVNGLVSRTADIGSISLSVGTSPISFEQVEQQTIPTNWEVNELQGDEVSVNIDGKDYNFDLKEGNNLFFVLQQPAREEEPDE